MIFKRFLSTGTNGQSALGQKEGKMSSCEKRRTTGRECQVVECSHGTIHLTIGNTTISMKADVYRRVVATLNLAENRLNSTKEGMTISRHLLQ